MDVLPTQLQFFSAALNLRAKYDVVRALNSAGYPPSNSVGFTLAQLRSSLQSAYGSQIDITVTCDNNGNIEEMTQCFSPSLQPMPCPSNAAGQCSASTLFLPSSM
jgi:ribonuclease I